MSIFNWCSLGRMPIPRKCLPGQQVCCSIGNEITKQHGGRCLQRDFRGKLCSDNIYKQICNNLRSTLIYGRFNRGEMVFYRTTNVEGHFKTFRNDTGRVVRCGSHSFPAQDSKGSIVVAISNSKF